MQYTEWNRNVKNHKSYYSPKRPELAEAKIIYPNASLDFTRSNTCGSPWKTEKSYTNPNPMKAKCRSGKSRAR